MLTIFAQDDIFIQIKSRNPNYPIKITIERDKIVKDLQDIKIIQFLLLLLWGKHRGLLRIYFEESPESEGFFLVFRK